MTGSSSQWRMWDTAQVSKGSPPPLPWREGLGTRTRVDVDHRSLVSGLLVQGPPVSGKPEGPHLLHCRLGSWSLPVLLRKPPSASLSKGSTLSSETWTQHGFSGLWPRGLALPKWREFLERLCWGQRGWCWCWLVVGRCLWGEMAREQGYCVLAWPTNQVEIPRGPGNTDEVCNASMTPLPPSFRAFTLG